MAKERISSVDLSWAILEELRNAGGPPGISLAVVHDDKDGWRVVVDRGSRPFLTAEGERRLAALQRKLRLKYDLAD
jgi:hypothetical protein